MTTKVEHSEKNIEKLAQKITEKNSLRIRQNFYEDQYNYYKNDKEAFLTDWKDIEIENENP